MESLTMAPPLLICTRLLRGWLSRSKVSEQNFMGVRYTTFTYLYYVPRELKDTTFVCTAGGSECDGQECLSSQALRGEWLPVGEGYISGFIYR